MDKTEIEAVFESMLAVLRHGYGAAPVSMPDAVRAMLARRFELAAPYVAGPCRDLLKWLVDSREASNYTYDLTPRNMEQLAGFVSAVDRVGDVAPAVEHRVNRSFFAELLTDARLQEIVRAAAEGDHMADPVGRFGRRLGWYALVRRRKPAVVVETGTEKGLGALVIAAALMRNGAGHCYTIDLDQNAGAYVLANEYTPFITRLHGNSLDVLRSAPWSSIALPDSVDLFIHDSDHSASHEAEEFRLIQPQLRKGALVLSDNSHVTDELSNFALRTGRQYLFFREEPAGHFYPGAGIGAAF